MTAVSAAHHPHPPPAFAGEPAQRPLGRLDHCRLLPGIGQVAPFTETFSHQRRRTRFSPPTSRGRITKWLRGHLPCPGGHGAVQGGEQGRAGHPRGAGRLGAHRGCRPSERPQGDADRVCEDERRKGRLTTLVYLFSLPVLWPQDW